MGFLVFQFSTECTAKGREETALSAAIAFDK
jgi:hypothetical protein